MQELLNGLRAAGEPTRLRILAILSEHELTVSELTRVLGQSQPRVSRHLKLLCEAGLLERIQEGTWAFYRLADSHNDSHNDSHSHSGAGARIVQALLELLPTTDPMMERDRERLTVVERAHAEAASAYFGEIAQRWDCVRSLYVPEAQVEASMLSLLGDGPIRELVDLGTGTGRILEVFSDRVDRGLGVDSSPEMLAVARAHLEQRRLHHCQVRRGDIYHLTLPAGCADLVTIHHVLHFLNDPATAVAEAARLLRPGGRLLVVDFAPHSMEFLRTDYAHRRLGFTDDEVRAWCDAAGLVEFTGKRLGCDADLERLSVGLWTANQDRTAPSHYKLEVA